jgi:hypothetical protein
MGSARFDDILRGLSELFEICRDLGLERQALDGRFGVYRATILHVQSEFGKLRPGSDPTPVYRRISMSLPNVLTALAESQEICGIVPFLRTCSQTAVAPRLSAVLKGPELRGLEDEGSNQARNIQFELWLATLLWGADVEVSLEEPDLALRLGNDRILVACKRLFSVHKLTRRINEATDQLRRHLAQKSGPAWGVIAVSLAKILTGTDRAETIANQTEGRAELAARIESLVERRAKWAQTREAQGVVFHAGSVFTNAETNRIETGHFWTLYGDGPICGAIAAVLGRVVRQPNQGHESP